MRSEWPIVLSLSGHDPSGGAGIQADIEAIISHQCQPATIITVLTEQDTKNVKTLLPQHSINIGNQIRTILADFPVSAIKIGLIGCPDIALEISNILRQNPQIPVVFDPVLAAGGGLNLSSDSLIAVINQSLLSFVTVLTPNSDEARRLTGLENLNECGLKLLANGCCYVLITGTHEQSSEVTNLLFHGDKCIKAWNWPRLPHSYHGSGCTLAASIAALLGRGKTELDAIVEAQQYTWNTLEAGFKPGKGQYIPDRLYWLDKQ